MSMSIAVSWPPYGRSFATSSQKPVDNVQQPGRRRSFRLSVSVAQPHGCVWMPVFGRAALVSGQVLHDGRRNLVFAGWKTAFMAEEGEQ